MEDTRFDRQIALFGKAGQQKLANAHVAIIGVGGVGSHVVQQLSFLGVGYLSVIDHDRVTRSSLNRLIGATQEDASSGIMKVDVARRMVTSVDRTIKVTAIPDGLISKRSFDEVKRSEFVFGCVDKDGIRLILNELCSAYEIPYLDLASDIDSHRPPTYGGRVFVNPDGLGCLYCRELISPEHAARDLRSSDANADVESVYGVPRQLLDETGPSVVSINGVVASLGVTEFMVMLTGLRPPKRLLNYYATRGIVNENQDQPYADCYYCKAVRGQRVNADVERYYRSAAEEASTA